jgi:hypothetical protein
VTTPNADARARKGRSQHQIQTAEPVYGDVIVGEERSDAFNRTTKFARFKLNGPHDPEPIPTLHEITLSQMGTLGFVLTGIEVIGDVAYPSRRSRSRPSRASIA